MLTLSLQDFSFGSCQDISRVLCTIQLFSSHRIRVSGLNSDTMARPPRRLPKAPMSLSEVLATAITSKSKGIAMQAMIKYFRPPNGERPSIPTIDTARLNGANQRATAVKLDAFAPSLIAIDASRAGIAFSVRWSKIFNLPSTSLMSISTSSRAF